MAAVLDKRLFSSYMNISQPKEKVQCMYVWIDGSLQNLRCKTRTMISEDPSITDLPRWEFCGSATELDVGDIADVYAQPIQLYRDPFRTMNNKLVLCETYTRDKLPTFANNRHRLLSAAAAFKNKDLKFEFFQPYSLFRPNGKPLCLSDTPCQISPGLFCGKEIAEAHYRACLYAGVQLNSLCAESTTGKWKYSVGHCLPAKLGDDLWISRFILHRVAEDFGIKASFDTQPLKAELSFNGSGVIGKDKQRMVDCLVDKFNLINIKPSATSGQIVIRGVNPESDPYSDLTKIFEAMSEI